MKRISVSGPSHLMKFGRLTIHSGLIGYVRAMAIGAKISVRAFGFEEHRKRDMDSLVGMGLAEVVSDGNFKGYGRNEVLTYVASQNLKDEAEYVERSRITFHELASRQGIVLSRDRMRSLMRKKRLFPDKKTYPLKDRVKKKFVELTISGKPVTENIPEEEGDEYQFSSPELTAWYVKEFMSYPGNLLIP